MITQIIAAGLLFTSSVLKFYFCYTPTLYAFLILNTGCSVSSCCLRCFVISGFSLKIQQTEKVNSAEKTGNGKDNGCDL